jgi:beta-phosphoglucomutase-like phosphatase (HAD superfamily)
VLGLPDGTRGCLFDLDGVLTQTAKVHAAAWKQMFDSYLRERSRRTGEPFVPFDPVEDYDEYVDGKLAGVAAGRAGHFRYVVGVDRMGQADALKPHGADTVVTDLAELLDHS